jgi:hypothetical protein
MVKVTFPIPVLAANTLLKNFDLENQFSVEEIAKQSGYYLQAAKKIEAYSLIFGFFKMMQNGSNSVRLWALQIGLVTGSTVAKSSVHDRLGPRTVDFVASLLNRIMSDRTNELRQSKPSMPGQKSLLEKFKNVYLGDSTCEKLPGNLQEEFPSSYSHGKSAATLRIQTIYNYTLERFERFVLGSFRENDQSAADLILEVAHAGDLVLRDMGYFVLENLRKMTQMDIFFISRFRPDTNLYDPVLGTQIDLKVLFRGKNKVDMSVLIGAKEKVPVRMVAQKVPKEVFEQRKKKARADRNKKTNHSEAYYDLLEWSIFITNVPLEILTALEVIQTYGLRWFIEIIFKAWKSHFHFSKMLNPTQMNYWRVLTTIYLMLIQIAFWSMNIYQYIKNGVEKLTTRPISILKYFDVLNALMERMVSIKFLQEIDPLIPQFAVHATYEKRKKRKNIKELHIT